MFDIDTYNQISKEEEKLALEGAYSDGSLVGEKWPISEETVY